MCSTEHPALHCLQSPWARPANFPAVRFSLVHPALHVTSGHHRPPPLLFHAAQNPKQLLTIMGRLHYGNTAVQLRVVGTQVISNANTVSLIVVVMTSSRGIVRVVRTSTMVTDRGAVSSGSLSARIRSVSSGSLHRHSGQDSLSLFLHQRPQPAVYFRHAPQRLSPAHCAMSATT